MPRRSDKIEVFKKSKLAEDVEKPVLGEYVIRGIEGAKITYGLRIESFIKKIKSAGMSQEDINEIINLYEILISSLEEACDENERLNIKIAYFHRLNKDLCKTLKPFADIAKICNEYEENYPLMTNNSYLRVKHLREARDILEQDK